MINSKRQLTKYVLSDYVMSNVAWLIFNIIRFFIPVVTSGYAELGDFLLSRNVVIGQIFMPIIMMLVYYLVFNGGITGINARSGTTQDLKKVCLG